MLKLKLPQSEFDALPDVVKSEYKKEGDVFLLDTDVKFEDTTALKNALNSEKEHRRQATERAGTLEAANTELQKKVTGDVTTLEASWKKKHDDGVAAEKAKGAKYRAQLEKVLVTDVAERLATSLSPDPHLLLPHIKDRLTVEETGDGSFITRVLDADKKPSALSVNEFSAEILADPKFARIVTASKASGGGAHGSQSKPPGGAKKFSELSEKERTDLFRANRQEYERLKTAGKK